MNGYWQYRTAAGTFQIRPIGGRYHVIFEDESLGAYTSPVHALDDLIGGHTFWPSSGVDPSMLGMADDLSEWKFLPS